MTEDEIRAQIAAKAVEMKLIDEKDTSDNSKTAETTAETVNTESNSDPFLEEALKMGYDPNHQGPNKKSAEQFVKDGSFFRKIDAQNKKIDDLLGVVKGLDAHTQKLQKAAADRERMGYEKAVRDLQIKRSEAVEEGDVNKFHRVEAELTDLNKQRPSEPLPSTPSVSEDMKKWADENKSWFNDKNPRLVKEASGLFDLEMEENPTRSHAEVLKTVKESLERLHPDKFENPNKNKPAAVLKSGSSSTSGISTGLEGRLSERQLNFYKSAKAAGVKMTIQDYAKQLEINGDLRND